MSAGLSAAVLQLTSHLDFLAVRKIPLKQRPPFDHLGQPSRELDPVEEGVAVSEALDKMRSVLVTDRGLHDKVTKLWRSICRPSLTRFLQAVKAFVSFVRAYSKHEASYIFRIKDLDLIGVAKNFGLLRLPRMPELKDCPRDNWRDAEVNVRLIPPWRVGYIFDFPSHAFLVGDICIRG